MSTPITNPNIATPLNNAFLQPPKPKPKVINYPAILIVGPSGSGKSRSIQGLPVDRTLVINCERKFLPFKDAIKYETLDPEDFFSTTAALKSAMESPRWDYIILDSFTKWWEMLHMRSAEINKGYDIYNYFNDNVTKMLEMIKKSGNKFIIFLSIDEIVKIPMPSGLEKAQSRCAIIGKRWEGKIEKEFGVTLFTEVKRTLKEPAVYTFLTNGDGTNSAKSPEGMFELNIPNSLKAVCDRMVEYHGLPTKSIDPTPISASSPITV